jgi:glutaredoxin
MNGNSLVNKFSTYVQPRKVFLFSKSYCPWCKKAKELLKSCEIDYKAVEVDIDDNVKNDEEFLNYLHEDSKFKTFPKIYIGNRCIGGFSDLSKMKDNMKLFLLLKKEGIRFPDDDLFNFEILQP